MVSAQRSAKRARAPVYRDFSVISGTVMEAPDYCRCRVAGGDPDRSVYYVSEGGSERASSEPTKRRFKEEEAAPR